jgi:hypothetical protein
MARNPRSDQPNLTAELEQVGLAFLDECAEAIEQELDAGARVFDVAKDFYGLLIPHLVSWRKADNAAWRAYPRSSWWQEQAREKVRTATAGQLAEHNPVRRAGNGSNVSAPPRGLRQG